MFTDHLTETEGHERLVGERLAAHGAKPSTIKDLAGALTGMGFGAFAMAQPDTPGKLVVHAFSYEHMEEAAYDLLARVAERAGDEETAQTAREIELQEQGMGDRLAGCFDRAANAALREVDPDDLQSQLNKYLADAHAIEAQALQLLEKGPQLAGTRELAVAFDEHRMETKEHQRLVEARLQSRDDAPSSLKDAVLRLGALNWGGFFQAQPDTPAKLAAFARGTRTRRSRVPGRVAPRAARGLDGHAPDDPGRPAGDRPEPGAAERANRRRAQHARPVDGPRDRPAGGRVAGRRGAAHRPGAVPAGAVRVSV